MSDGGSSEELIERARDLPGRPHARRFISPATVESIFFCQTLDHVKSPYIAYHSCESKSPAGFQSYAQFLIPRVWALGAGLQRVGVGQGTRIVTAMHNHDRTIALYLAAWNLGACVVPLNIAEDDRRLAHAICHSHATVLICFDEYATRIHPLIKNSNVKKFVCAGPGEESDSSDAILNQNLKAADTLQYVVGAPAKPQPDNEALIVYTSGTTGTPKGVVLTQYNLAVDAWSIAQWHGFTPETRLLCVLPIHHVNGIVVSHLAPLIAGGSVVLCRKFSAHTFFQTVARYGITVVSVVPTLLQFLLDATPADFDAKKSAPTLKYFICGAGPLTVDLAARFEDRFGIPICHGYGLSETTCYACFLPVEGLTTEHRGWMREHGYPSIGLPLPINEMAIHDDHGKALGPGEKGEIVARGHNITPGYFENPAANEAAFTHGWFRSGDEGFYKTDAAGRPFFFISGRFKELIIRGGVKISPLEVDEVLNRIPGVENHAFGRGL